nr:MAG TPA: hypothetical protein [Caudoviricetes sp.]
MLSKLLQLVNLMVRYSWRLLVRLILRAEQRIWLRKLQKL